MRTIPTITKNLLIINLIAYLATLVPGIDDSLADIFGLHFVLAPDFQVYQLLTYMFVHAGFMHLFFNMFALWMFGCVVERVWGARRFLLFYLSCGVGAGLFQEAAQIFEFYSIVSSQMPSLGFSDIIAVAQNSGEQLNLWTTVGASGAVYAILLAFGMTFPEERIFIFPFPVPIKAKWFVIIYAGIEIFSAISISNDNVAHLAHLGGMVFGYFMIRYWRRHPGGGYEIGGGRQFFDNLRQSWEQRTQRRGGQTDRHGGTSGSGRQGSSNSSNTRSTGNPDWDYNARKRARQEEIDRILDKIRRSGYDSLTKEEKQKLFDSSDGN